MRRSSEEAKKQENDTTMNTAPQSFSQQSQEVSNTEKFGSSSFLGCTLEDREQGRLLSSQNNVVKKEEDIGIDEKEISKQFGERLNLDRRPAGDTKLYRSSRDNNTWNRPYASRSSTARSYTSEGMFATSRRSEYNAFSQEYGRVKLGLQAQLEEAIADAEKLSAMNERHREHFSQERARNAALNEELQALRDENTSLKNRIWKLEHREKSHVPMRRTFRAKRNIVPSPEPATSVETLAEELSEANEQNEVLREKSIAMEAANVQVSAEVERLNRTILLMKRRMSQTTMPNKKTRFGFRTSVTPDGPRRRVLPMSNSTKRPSVSPMSAISDSSISSIPRASTLHKNARVNVGASPSSKRTYDNT